jgi:hypothetical protein
MKLLPAMLNLIAAANWPGLCAPLLPVGGPVEA